MLSEKKSKWQEYFNLRKINSVIRFLTLSDIFLLGAFGLIAPVFAVFVVDGINRGTLEVVGIAEGIYLVTRSIGQIPFAAAIDKIKGEKDDFWALLVGSIIFSVIPLFYIITTEPWQLYLIQFFYGLASAATYPSWYAIFTRHIDKNHEGVEWGVYQTLIDFSMAATASLGGFIAYNYGFTQLFVVVCVLSMIGSAFILAVYKKMRSGSILFSKK
jgi:MFS family permease